MASFNSYVNLPEGNPVGIHSRKVNGAIAFGQLGTVAWKHWRLSYKHGGCLSLSKWGTPKFPLIYIDLSYVSKRHLETYDHVERSVLPTWFIQGAAAASIADLDKQVTQSHQMPSCHICQTGHACHSHRCIYIYMYVNQDIYTRLHIHVYAVYVWYTWNTAICDAFSQIEDSSIIDVPVWGSGWHDIISKSCQSSWRKIMCHSGKVMVVF